MIQIEEAEKIINSIAVNPETEAVLLPDSLGRILAQDVISGISMPPFDKSAMDGYAYNADDDSAQYKVMEIIAAGSVPRHTLKKGQCSKIMTGAMLPPGADAVVKVEVTEEENGLMRITGEDPRRNICFLGEDVKPGDVVLTKDRLIRPPEVGVMASMGMPEVKVYKKTKVGIITTGSEIVEPGTPLKMGQIYNSNAYSISSQVRQTGALVTYAGLVGDDIDGIRLKIDNLISESDMVLISGGVSMGDYDFVPGILIELGVELHFSKVAIQPGKPTVFGTRGNKLIFGMPGNPVSTFTIFEVFVKPLLYKTMGLEFSPMVFTGTMNRDFKRKRTIRAAYIPVCYQKDGGVEPVEYHGSAHINSLAQANGLIRIDRGEQEILKGSTVYVRQI